MAFTRHGYLHRTKPGPELPLAAGSSQQAWLDRRHALLPEVRVACKFVLQSGATSLAQRGYDIAPLASEKVLSPELIVDPKAAPTRPHLLPDAKQVSKKANDNSESQAMSNEPQGTMPWSIIVVLIVGGASGLLWLLLKRRS